MEEHDPAGAIETETAEAEADAVTAPLADEATPVADAAAVAAVIKPPVEVSAVESLEQAAPVNPSAADVVMAMSLFLMMSFLLA